MLEGNDPASRSEAIAMMENIFMALHLFMT